MKINFEESNNDMVFRISEFDAKYEDVLKMCFYSHDGDSYSKGFPKDTKYLDKIMTRFFDHAQEMFDQLGYFAPIPWERALLEFAKEVEDSDVNWWLTGSCAVCVRGTPLHPHDVDIMVDSDDVERISDIFSDYLIEPIIDTGGWVTKEFGVIFKHARIDIASESQAVLDEPEPIDCGPYAKANLECVVWEGYPIRVPPLQLSLNANRRRGRSERVIAIEDFLKDLP